MLLFLLLFPAVIIAALYARRVQALRGTRRAVPGWRQVCEAIPVPVVK